jgi:23S rRNA pseudouridine2605 synthase
MRNSKPGQPSREKSRTIRRPDDRSGSADARKFTSKSRPQTGAKFATKPASSDGDSKFTKRPVRAKLPRPIEGAPAELMRIAKAMARAGLCSRRDAERWIEEGRVVVNNQVIKSPALDVGPRDRIKVDGVELPSAGTVKLWRYYKPKGTVTTHRDPEGRPTVFEKMPEDMPRVISIGRLDFNTEGLLLLTNDGDLARFIELPATGWLRRYRVRAMGSVTQEQLDGLKDGIEIEGVRYGPVEATLDSVKGSNVWLTIGLREGKNREVRKILGSLLLEVNRLIRISFGPFQLMDLEEGKIEQVKRRVLADQLGPDLAKRFGLDVAPEDEGGKSVRNSGYRARPVADAPDGAPGQGRGRDGAKLRPRADKHDAKGERAAPRRFADRKPVIGAQAQSGAQPGGVKPRGKRDTAKGKPAAEAGVSANALAIRRALGGDDDGDDRPSRPGPARAPKAGRDSGRDPARDKVGAGKVGAGKTRPLKSARKPR